jgi:MFS family permease
VSPSATGTVTEAERRFGLRPVLNAISVVTVGVMPAFLLGGLAVQAREELGFGADALGLAVALFFASSAVASPTAGRVVERLGASLGMRVTAVGAALSMLGVALVARSWLALVACLVLGGLSNALSHPSSNLSLARQVPEGRQGLSFGIKQSAIPAATLLAGLAVPLVATTVGWR